MIMKRLFIAAVLLLVVVTVTYIKSVRGTDQRREAFEHGKDYSGKQLVMLQQDVDSLKALLKLQEEAFADSLAERDGLYRAEISRLVGFLDSVVAHPKQRPKAKIQTNPNLSPTTQTQSKPKAVVKAEPSKPSSSEAVVEQPETQPAVQEPQPEKLPEKTSAEQITPALREQVLTYYGKLYSELPKDLTSQERKVALYEISIKTAAEYSISMQQLKAICKDYYLSY